MLAVYSAVVGILSNYLIALIYFYPRPFAQGMGQTLIKHINDASFPSDHTTFMLSVAVLFFYFSKTRKTGIFLIILGLLGGLARVFCGIHFPLDILGSLIVSLVIARIVYILRNNLDPINNFILRIYSNVFSK